MGKLSTAAKIAASAAAAASKRGKTVTVKVAQGAKATRGPSPNAATNLILADIALRGGGALLRHAVERGLLGAKYAPDKAKALVKGRSMAQTLISTAVARIATRSVPGAILVGGGLLAKTLYDRAHAQQAAATGKAKVAKQAAKGGNDT